MSVPVVSFIIPTRNSERHLRACLASIRAQESPVPYEVLVIDGGSEDGTVGVAKEFGATLLHNPSRVAYNQEGPEGSKAIGVRASRGELLAFVDADNALAAPDWIACMLEPFRARSDVAIAEPSKWARRDDSAVNRYCSSLVTRTARGDPFSLGSPVRGSWTERVPGERFAVWRAEDGRMPTIANGTMVRRDAVLAAGGYDYDSDLTRRIVNGGAPMVATVRSTGVHHDYVPTMRALVKKARWRSSYTAKLIGSGTRDAPDDLASRGVGEIALNVLLSLTVVGPLLFALARAIRDRDATWLMHPLVVLLVTAIFAWNALPRLPTLLRTIGRRQPRRQRG